MNYGPGHDARETLLVQMCIEKQLGFLLDPTGCWFSRDAWAEQVQRSLKTPHNTRFWDSLERHPILQHLYRRPPP